MKNKNKHIAMQQQINQYGGLAGQQSQQQVRTEESHRQATGKGHKGKLAGLNQSMDAGINNYSAQLQGYVGHGQGTQSKMSIQGQEQYHQNYVSNTFEGAGPDGFASGPKPAHYRSGSHAVGGAQPAVASHKGQKKQQTVPAHYKGDSHDLSKQLVFNMSQGAANADLTPAQLAQLAQIQQKNFHLSQEQIMGVGQGDGSQQPKGKRKQSQPQRHQKNNESGGKGRVPDGTLALQGGVGSSQPGGSLQVLHQSANLKQSTKRSNEGGPNGDKKMSRYQLTGPDAFSQSQGGTLFESARYNSIGAMHNQATIGNGQTSGSNLILSQTAHHGGQSKDRFQGSQKLSKKATKVAGQGGQIVLPAGAGMQGVPQLKTQLQKGHLTHSNKAGQQIPLTHSVAQFQQHSHQRMHSLQDSSQVGANMQRGFNSASNAAMQQQAQIMQIYQQQSSGHAQSTHSTGSMGKQKYGSNQGNNSRKVIPQLGQVMGSHKRAQQNLQHSRDRHNNSLMSGSYQKQMAAESYQANNYQTYSQNYHTTGGASSQLQLVASKKASLADTSRVNRLPSREQASRRALGGADVGNVKIVPGEHHNQYGSGSHGAQSLTIPQKKQKQMQTQKLKSSLGPGGNLHGDGPHGNSFNQTAAHGFFNDTAASHSAHLLSTGQQKSDHANARERSQGQPNGGQHQKSGSQFPPQTMQMQSLKHTLSSAANEAVSTAAQLNNVEGLLLQPKKSGPVAAQSHIRQTSVQVAVDASSQSKKLSVQHRKNKSVLSNQIRINPNLQNHHVGASNSGKMRVSQESSAGKHKLTQYIDNYADQVSSNYYMQQLTGPKANLSATQKAHQLQGSASNLTNAALKHTLSQSTHRKNKTSVIGGAQKMFGINSSSAFQHPSNLPPSLVAGEHQGAPNMKKVIGGTISHSHKSLRSQSSTRKRVGSVDSTSGLNHIGGSGKDSATRYNLPMGHHPQGYSKSSLQGAHSGHLTPDLSSYANTGQGAGSKQHQQKVHKLLNSQANGGQLRQNLRPQGNIVIQQAVNGKSGHASSLMKASQGNRRHSSILKGEHQDKQMIFVDQENNIASKQAVASRFGGHPQNARMQPQPAHGGGPSSDFVNEQDSLGSVSSMRATNTAFQDGGTGGGNQKPKARQMSASRGKEGSASKPQGSFNTDQKIPASKRDQFAENSTDDYNLRTDLARQKGKGQPPHAVRRTADIDDADIAVPAQTDSSSKRAGAAAALNASGLDFKQFAEDSNMFNRRQQLELAGLEYDQHDSINITKEALDIGKIPPEQVADLIATKGHAMSPSDRGLSPRTREMLYISKQIQKSFAQRGDAPKTTPEFYRAGKMLGRGAFGKVSLGMHKLSRKLVALKSINKEYMSDEKQKSKVMHEVGILLRLRHRSVVKLYETFETKRHMLLAMELCAGGDLLNYVRKRKKLDEAEAKVIFKQIIEGLGYIHKKRILHRDIKLDNILLDGKGNVKIADFGVSKLVKPGDVMHEQSGTPAYIAPEILREQGYSGFKADIWSAGVVLYAMLQGTVPFKASNMKELHKMIIKGKYHFKEEVSDGAKQLMKAMLDTDPRSRISISKILKHPWLQLPASPVEIFNQEEKEFVKKEFIYNNPRLPNRSEKVNKDVEPWDCFTELNLDSINETLRNESEKSVILAPFNSSLSDFDEEEFQGMGAELIIHRLFEDAAPLQDKKATLRFAARCRDQDRQYEINNNGELDNGVYHKFVYSSRDGNPDPSSSADELRPQSSRNRDRPSGDRMFKNEIEKRVKEGKQFESEATDAEEYGLEDSADSHQGLDGAEVDDERINTLMKFGYPEAYIRYCLVEGEACYCMAAYYLLGEDQRY